MTDTDLLILMASVVALAGTVLGYGIGKFGGAVPRRARASKRRR